MSDIDNSTDSEVPFGDRAADCDECEVTEQNTVVIMEDVILGERLPENWWCDKHVDEFEAETCEYAENRELNNE